jgi:hypothetical protein
LLLPDLAFDADFFLLQSCGSGAKNVNVNVNVNELHPHLRKDSF